MIKRCIQRPVDTSVRRKDYSYGYCIERSGSYPTSYEGLRIPQSKRRSREQSITGHAKL